MPSNIKASRGWKFVIPLDPNDFSDVHGYGDYRPHAFPEKMRVRFARGQCQFSEQQPESEEAERNVEFVGYFESAHQLSFYQVQNWLKAATFTSVEVKNRELAIKEVTDAFKEIKSVLTCGIKWSIGDEDVGGQGRRTDFDEIKDILKQEGPTAGVKRVAEEFPTHFIRYHAGIQRLADVVEILPTDEKFRPNPFQQTMIEQLKKAPHPRHIYWVYDKAGHSGKSRLAKYLQCEMGAIELQGREVDIAYGYNGQRIVLFDIPRATPLTNYNEAFVCAERLKNGGIFSTKFACKFKRFEAPHIVFLSNEPPIAGTWTSDRLQLITIEGPPPPPFQPFTTHNIPPPPPYKATVADTLKDRMNALTEEQNERITCVSCRGGQPDGHMYDATCRFNLQAEDDELCV